MKTIKKSLSLILIILSNLVTSSELFAQSNVSTCTGPDLLYSQSGTISIIQGVPSALCPTGNLTFLGINNTSPAYITDILGNYTGDGVNISYGLTNAVGYSIGGSLFLPGMGAIKPLLILELVAALLIPSLPETNFIILVWGLMRLVGSMVQEHKIILQLAF